MDHQDWKPVILKKKTTTSSRGGAAGAGSQKKYNGGTNKQSAQDRNLRKLDEDELPTTRHYDVGFRRRLQQARQEKKMTQKELAQKCSVKQTVIVDCENGKGDWDNQLVNKMERVLGTRLRKVK
jgi:putative transcription factor